MHITLQNNNKYNERQKAPFDTAFDMTFNEKTLLKHENYFALIFDVNTTCLTMYINIDFVV